MEIKELFVVNLKKFRKMRGISQAMLAEKTGFSLGFIGELERGNSWVSPEAIEKIALILNVPSSAFFAVENNIFIETPASIVIKKMSLIPDEIYDYAERVGEDKDIWDAVKGTIEGQLKVREMRKAKKNQA